ncbi:hypothetical protein LCGC14_0363420 [marine sediment metagenome]|uniref:Uncharacterized protein n=1 Tax=marine sediment metagenome TaxID=412755 RepID=A0A0F9T7F5_9ZZZZ
MQLVSFVVQHYVALPYQKFTEKVIAALAIFQVIQKQTQDPKKVMEFENDELEIMWIEENTNTKVMVPIYVLDRCVNPAKGEFRVTQNKVTFDTNIPDENAEDMAKQVELTENQIQKYLCMAIRRVNDIVMKNVKAYSEEIPIPDLGMITTEPGLDFKDV